MAIKRNLIAEDFVDRLPIPLKLQSLKASFENSIFLGEKIIELNKFQTRVYDSYLENDAISISAPTSAGKSFILCNIIIEELLKGDRNLIYIVPTRALIAQVEDDLRKQLTEYGLYAVNLTTVPQTDHVKYDSNVFVFTQERLHWFLLENFNLQIHAVIVDEAHKIEDSYRGILLQQKLEDLIRLNSNIKVYFSSPFTSNPELLLDGIPDDHKREPIKTEFISVNQNLIYCSQIPRRSTDYAISLSWNNRLYDLGILKLKNRPAGEYKKMAFMAADFSGDGSGNIIYSNGAAEAEKIALALFDKVGIQSKPASKLAALIDLVKKTVHREYRLANVLARGIAFHYGNMPLLIRQEIENLFKEGEIKYLVCTSTLLEGVNLPAKSVFIRKPKRGPKPLNQNDFWNLAGRAGRWGKEFSGNIICIEPASWPEPPNPVKKRQKIVRALDIIETKQNELLEYINSGTPRETAETRQDLEFALGYYYNLFIDNRLNANSELTQKLQVAFQAIAGTIKVPQQILKRNPGISPLAQQALLDYFMTTDASVDTLLPVYPEDENAYDEYTKLVGRIGKTLSAYPPQLNASRAILLINWMAGKPLSAIILATFKSYQKKPKYASIKNIHVVIREVMDAVETFARFRFAKDSSCYVDILRYFLSESKREDLLDIIPQLNLWLEFGVSQKTHLSLLSLGLTRNTVVEISQYIANTEIGKEEAIDWLNSQDLTQYGLSSIILEDISTKMSKYKPEANGS